MNSSQPLPLTTSSMRPETPIRAAFEPLAESPFSDYYTDASSLSPQDCYTSTQKALLHRLALISAQIVDKKPLEHTAALLTTKIDAVDAVLTHLHDISEYSTLNDSALFLDEDDDGDLESLGIGSSIVDLGIDFDGGDDHKSELSGDELDEVLRRLSTVAAQLKTRYDEVKQINEVARLKLDNAADEILTLRSENDSLRSDLLTTTSDLLLLDFALKSLEIHWGLHDQDAFPNDVEHFKAEFANAKKQHITRTKKYEAEPLKHGEVGDESPLRVQGQLEATPEPEAWAQLDDDQCAPLAEELEQRRDERAVWNGAASLCDPEEPPARWSISYKVIADLQSQRSEEQPVRLAFCQGVSVNQRPAESRNELAGLSLCYGAGVEHPPEEWKGPTGLSLCYAVIIDQEPGLDPEGQCQLCVRAPEEEEVLYDDKCAECQEEDKRAKTAFWNEIWDLLAEMCGMYDYN